MELYNIKNSLLKPVPELCQEAQEFILTLTFDGQTRDHMLEYLKTDSAKEEVSIEAIQELKSFLTANETQDID